MILCFEFVWLFSFENLRRPIGDGVDFHTVGFSFHFFTSRGYKVNFVFRITYSLIYWTVDLFIFDL